MKFDKSRVYSALNADELHAGDTVILADNIAALRRCVEGDKRSEKLREIVSEDWPGRFFSYDDCHYYWAYLVERAPEVKYVPWDRTNCPLKCGDIINKCEENGRVYKYSIIEIEQMSIDDENNGYCDLVYFGANALSYEMLLSGGYTFNGKPCGQEVTPDAEV